MSAKKIEIFVFASIVLLGVCVLAWVLRDRYLDQKIDLLVSHSDTRNSLRRDFFDKNIIRSTHRIGAEASAPLILVFKHSLHRGPGFVAGANLLWVESKLDLSAMGQYGAALKRACQCEQPFIAESSLSLLGRQRSEFAHAALSLQAPLDLKISSGKGRLLGEVAHLRYAYTNESLGGEINGIPVSAKHMSIEANIQQTNDTAGFSHYLEAKFADLKIDTYAIENASLEGQKMIGAQASLIRLRLLADSLGRKGGKPIAQQLEAKFAFENLAPEQYELLAQIAATNWSELDHYARVIKLSQWREVLAATPFDANLFLAALHDERANRIEINSHWYGDPASSTIGDMEKLEDLLTQLRLSLKLELAKAPVQALAQYGFALPRMLAGFLTNADGGVSLDAQFDKAALRINGGQLPWRILFSDLAAMPLPRINLFAQVIP